MIENGEYEVDVSLEGGSGRASVTSPAKLVVLNGSMKAEIEWSSSNYTYMEVEGKEYTPVNNGGNSCFLIDVSALDSDIPVKAETHAMSTAHLIEYTLRFDSQSVRSISANSASTIVFACAGCLLVAAVVFAALKIRKRNAVRKSDNEVV